MRASNQNDREQPLFRNTASEIDQLIHAFCDHPLLADGSGALTLKLPGDTNATNKFGQRRSTVQ